MDSNGGRTLESSDAAPTGPTESSVPSQEMVQSCLAVVESHRSGDITIAQAATRFYHILPDDDRSEAALEHYLDICSASDRERTLALIRGNQTVGPSTHPEGGETSSPEVEPTTAAVGAGGCEGSEYGDSSANLRAKRPHSSVEAADPKQGKAKQGPPDYVWLRRPPKSQSVEACISKTLALKAEYHIDLKAAKTNLITQPDCPNFPEGLWSDVLADRFVDLDKVYSGYYTLEPDHRHTETVGNLDITLTSGGGAGKPDKTIGTHGEWSIAFSAAKAAVLYAYPHRAEEFAQYEEFIIGQFSALDDVREHIKVINLDRAIRLRISRGNALSLISYGSFTDLFTRHLYSKPSTVERESKRSKSGVSTSQPICRRFNAGRCTSDGCKYRHICSLCSGRHQAKECGTPKKPGAEKGGPY